VSYICTDATVDAAVWEIEVSPFIPLAGTDGTNLVTGNIEVTGGVEMFVENSAKAGVLWDDGLVQIYGSALDASENTSITVNQSNISVNSDVPTFDGIVYNSDYSANFNNLSLINQEVLKKRIWTKAGTPTVTDDASLGYLVGSLIWDTTNSILYKCTDNTGGAAVWSAAIAGGGDMLKSVYDTDNDGIVDSAETVQIVVRNSTGSTLTKGQVVYLSGATGNRPNAILAQADTEATSDKTIGIVVANIANNADGQIAVSGTLHNLDTSAFTAGDAVWLSAATAGAITATAPAEPNHTVFIGYIARAHPTQGRLVIAIQNGYELDDIHGVSITTPATDDYLYYAADGLWKNRALPSPVYLELVRTGSVIPVSATRYAAEGLAGIATSIVITIAPRKLFTTFRVFITTTQPASGTLTVMRKFYNIAGTEIGSQSLVIAASSVAGIYEYTGATYDMSATNGSYGFTIVNAATSSSANVNSIESVYE
jgi:hypothetical protein